ncbi:MAG: hypothetical protein EPN55_01030 [Gammaproteobacteria bacterium]|nr:MAG: hypothetical protein EPN55_01030 [Gammaproteobacteria bacterium]
MHLADLLIHVNETLRASDQASLEEELRKVEGVVAPRFSSETPHLLLVAYDPEETDSHNLLSRVKDSGYHAQLIGM